MPADLALGGVPGALKASGTCAQELHETGGNGDPFLKGAHRLSCVLGPRAKQRLHRYLGQTRLQFLENLLGKQGVNVAHCGGRALEAKLLGIFISLCFSGGDHFGETWPHPSALRSCRPNNNSSGITAPPISKQAAERSSRHTAASNLTQRQSPTH